MIEKKNDKVGRSYAKSMQSIERHKRPLVTKKQLERYARWLEDNSQDILRKRQKLEVQVLSPILVEKELKVIHVGEINDNEEAATDFNIMSQIKLMNIN